MEGSVSDLLIAILKKHGVRYVCGLPAAFERACEAGRPAVIDIGVEYTPHPMDFIWSEIILHGLMFPEPSRMRAVV